jgi:carotenoid cleavage dioxygenase
MNAFDDGAATVLDVCRYERTFDTGEGTFLGSTLPWLERWRVDPLNGRLEASQLDDRPVEFPRIDDSLAGRPYRYGYAVEMERREDTDTFTGLIRYDLVRDEAVHWDPGEGRAPGEPVFVRAADGHADDEGYVLSVVYDPGRNASDLVVLDASSFARPPLAVVHLPARVPFGFHGSWVPAASYR